MLSFFQPLFFYPFFFFFGLAVGSFLNCLIYRLEKNETPFWGRSYCPNCQHILSWQDLIPLLSFFLLKGKCRYCQKPISFQYPLVEIATGILFVLIIFYFSSDFLFSIFYFLISCFLIVIFVYDLKHYLIPDKIIYPAIIIAGIFNFFTSTLNFGAGAGFLIFSYSILAAILAAAFFLAIVLISQYKWMGVGDIKLAFLMGLILGWPNILVALFFAFLLGAFVGTILIIVGKKTLKSEVPFGPFLVTGTFISIFFGPQIVSFYQSLFLIY